VAEHDYKGAIIALANYIAAIAPALRRVIEEPGQKIALFALSGDEEVADDPYTILRSYPGGNAGNRPIGALALQLFTVGATGQDRPNDAGTLARAQLVHGRLLDANHRPRQSITTGGFYFHSFANVRAPGLVGRREGKVEYASNFDIFFKAA
jgi:hypothetical protein